MVCERVRKRGRESLWRRHISASLDFFFFSFLGRMLRELHQQDRYLMAILIFFFHSVDFQIIPLNLSLSEGRFLNAFPPIATKYILSQFQCCWQQNEIETIKKFINNTLLVINNECTVSFEICIYGNFCM